jgi:hypothetical protein
MEETKKKRREKKEESLHAFTLLITIIPRNTKRTRAQYYNDKKT